MWLSLGLLVNFSLGIHSYTLLHMFVLLFSVHLCNKYTFIEKVQMYTCIENNYATYTKGKNGAHHPQLLIAYPSIWNSQFTPHIQLISNKWFAESNYLFISTEHNQNYLGGFSKKIYLGGNLCLCTQFLDYHLQPVQFICIFRNYLVRALDVSGFQFHTVLAPYLF